LSSEIIGFPLIWEINLLSYATFEIKERVVIIYLLTKNSSYIEIIDCVQAEHEYRIETSFIIVIAQFEHELRN